jgi:MoaA/NifB/PqqE/SkfB family radical SAM enzyme
MKLYGLPPNAWLPLVQSRYRRLDTFWSEFINQTLRLLRLPHVFRLTTVGIETNNTCNLKCAHCPTNTTMQRAKGFMSWQLFQNIIDQNPGIKRVYLTNWGEPLLHPQLVEMIDYAHQKGKLTALTTNATILDESTSRQLIQAGLNILKISIDGGEESFEKVRGFAYQTLEKNVLNFVKLRNALGAQTWIEASMLVFEETLPHIEQFFNLWKNRVDYVHLQPKFFTFKRKKMTACRDLWRILVVLWDGTVVPCCADAEGELTLGNATTDSLEDIFKGARMTFLRRAHLRGDLSGLLCEKCLPYFTDYHISVKRAKQLKLNQSQD